MATSKMPSTVSPMLCTLSTAPVQSAGYIYELKWDEYRIVSKVTKDKVTMNSRSGLDYTGRYPLIAEALASLGHDLMIDGEVVVFNEDGKPDFDTLQLYNGKRSPIRYCIFDLLYLDGSNLILVIDEEEAKIVRFIHETHLKGIPLYLIKSKAIEMGYDRTGNGGIERILTSPVYAGFI